MVHQGGHEGSNGGTMVIVAMYNVPDGIKDLAGSAEVVVADMQLEVAHLTVECRRHLTWCEGHGEIGKESDAEDTKVIGKTDGVDDGAGTDIDQRASRVVGFLQVEAYMGLTTHDKTETVVVDDEGRLLAHQQTEYGVVAMYHTEFTIKESILA